MVWFLLKNFALIAWCIVFSSKTIGYFDVLIFIILFQYAVFKEQF